MREMNVQCWFGRKWDRMKRKWVKPSSCTNRASGVYAVTTEAFGKEIVTPWMLCAECGMNKMAAQVRMFLDERGEARFYHPVKRIKLLASLTTDFVPPPEKTEIPAIKFTRERIVTKGGKTDFKPMDMAAYRRKLTKHDDEL